MVKHQTVNLKDFGSNPSCRANTNGVVAELGIRNNCGILVTYAKKKYSLH